MRAAWIAASLPLLLLAGCGLWGGDAPKPRDLQPVTASISGRAVWNAKLDKIEFPLAVAASGDRFTLADSDGTVLALRAQDGAEIWRARAGEKLSAGVGSDGRWAAVVTRAQELVVFDEGKLVWRERLPAPVHTAPLVAGERVFVLGADRAVLAFDAVDGRKLWELRRPGDALLLAQAGGLMAYKDTLVAGQGPRLAGIDPLRGTLRWEANLTNPRGTNEVERLADIVAPVVRVGDLLCGRAFQAAVGCIHAGRGSLVWNRQHAGAVGVAADDAAVIGVDGVGRLSAWRTANGESLWSLEDYLHRAPSAPLLAGKSLVFGDFQGFVHWLDRDSGKPQLRLQAGSAAIVARPALLGTTLLVVNRDGGVHAFRPE